MRGQCGEAGFEQLQGISVVQLHALRYFQYNAPGIRQAISPLPRSDGITMHLQALCQVLLRQALALAKNPEQIPKGRSIMMFHLHENFLQAKRQMWRVCTSMHTRTVHSLLYHACITTRQRGEHIWMSVFSPDILT